MRLEFYDCLFDVADSALFKYIERMEKNKVSIVNGTFAAVSYMLKAYREELVNRMSSPEASRGARAISSYCKKIIKGYDGINTKTATCIKEKCKNIKCMHSLHYDDLAELLMKIKQHTGNRFECFYLASLFCFSPQRIAKSFKVLGRTRNVCGSHNAYIDILCKINGEVLKAITNEYIFSQPKKNSQDISDARLYCEYAIILHNLCKLEYEEFYWNLCITHDEWFARQRYAFSMLMFMAFLEGQIHREVRFYKENAIYEMSKEIGSKNRKKGWDTKKEKYEPYLREAVEIARNLWESGDKRKHNIICNILLRQYESKGITRYMLNKLIKPIAEQYNMKHGV